MNKREFILALSKGLAGLPYEEQDKWLDFYSEMIDDRIEEGLSETEAVEAIGPVEDVIRQVLAQAKPVKKEKKRRELKTWHWVLLIAGSPVWFSLLIAAASIIFSLMVAAWAVVIGFYAIGSSLVACGVAGVALLPIMIIKGNVGAGIAGLGAGLFCAGLGIFWIIGTHYITKGVVWLCKKLFETILPGKEAVQ